MKFEKHHIEAFCAASHDRNPLHVDSDYARRSQFGKPVVYGMAAVLYGLGQWADGRSFRLRSLRANFRKPLFQGEDYDVLIDQTAKGTSIKFRKGPVDYAVITCVADVLAGHPERSETVSAPFDPPPAAATEPQTGAGDIHYAMNAGAGELLVAAFRLGPHSLPSDQLATLLWTSYHVGMVLPGRQALYSELQIEFAAEHLPSAAIQLQLDAAEFDERFNRYMIRGQGPGVKALRIAAFQRPLPVDFPLRTMPAFADGDLPLRDKVVFISGATRGFGAAMARVCALAGARLVLNYRSDTAAANALVAELAANGTEAAAFVADMAAPPAVAAMAAAIVEKFGRIDLIVNNAAPPIRDLQFLEQDNSDFVGFVTRNLGITLETAKQLLPLLAKGGQFFHVSTKYLAAPRRGFAHYLTAKAAQEALVQSLALEYGDHHFIVARLPRILTDQTNLAFDFDPPRHPGEVAREAILAITRETPSGNFRLIDFLDPDA